MKVWVTLANSDYAELILDEAGENHALIYNDRTYTPEQAIAANLWIHEAASCGRRDNTMPYADVVAAIERWDAAAKPYRDTRRSEMQTRIEKEEQAMEQFARDMGWR